MMEIWVPESRLDRVGDLRVNPAWVRALWEGEGTWLLTVGPDSALPVDPVGGLRLSAPEGDLDPQRHHLVGLVDGHAVFTVDGDPQGPTAPGRLAMAGLDDTDRDVAVTAIALVNWHRAAPHCGICGSMTEVRQAGHVRHCPTCRRDRFPRTDPAVITAVLDQDDRLLLAHNTAWDARRMSLLAGFVDAGESLEQAVRREVMEEAGLPLTEVRYVASQPWPFPRSLMLGYAARAGSTAIQVDGDEIDRAEFFTRERYREELEAGRLGTPTPTSIAGTIIGLWRRGELQL